MANSIFPVEFTVAFLPLPDGAIALIVGRKAIEAGSLREIRGAVDGLLSSIDNAKDIAGRYRLVVDGYNDDPRDLSQVPEVRAFFRKVSEMCPAFPLLLEPERTGMELYLALAAGAKREIHGDDRKDAGMFVELANMGTMIDDVDALNAVISGFERAYQDARSRLKLDAVSPSHPVRTACEASKRAFDSAFGVARMGAPGGVQ